MPLQPGTTLGPYAVTAKIGEGGMGEVYRARDTTLDRDVALKVLPDAFTADPDRLARFEREAKVLASLNHPNIAAIYGLEEAEGVRALVLELVEGPTLADRIKQGPIPLDEALPIAKQIAEALEAAHEAGVIHRDLKPANIKVRDDGTVKVLDFGLAKALDPNPEGDPSQSPTLTAAATQMGVIMGTAAYMSPEQARGKTVDKRADIWAFGAVLFEMLTGKRAFEGEDVSVTLADVIRAEPAWDRLPASVPPSLQTYLQRCLDKDPTRRVQAIGDMRLAMEGAFEAPGRLQPVRSDGPEPSRWRRLLPWVAGILLAVVTGMVVGNVTRSRPPRPVSFTLSPNERLELYLSFQNPDVAFAPNGRLLAYVGTADSRVNQLHLRSLDRLTSEVFVSEGEPVNPFFSPDNLYLAFYDSAEAAIKRIAVAGGPEVTICDIAGGNLWGASWGDDGSIVFATADQESGLWRVPAIGGEPELLTTPGVEGQRDQNHYWPEVLPGGEAILFVSLAVPTEESQIMILSLDTMEQKPLLRGTHPRYLPTGHLLYGLEGDLWAIRFDVDQQQTVDDPVPVRENILTKGFGALNYGVSDDGSLVYMPDSAAYSGDRTLVWVDRTSGEETPLAAPSRAYYYPRISPDETRISLSLNDQAHDAWIWNVGDQTLSRLTFDPAIEEFAEWTPDGLRIIFSSTRLGGVPVLFWKPADGTGVAERLGDLGPMQFPQAVSPDGSALIVRTIYEGTTDLITMSLTDDQDTRGLVETEFRERNATFSPDGEWFAYESDASGQFEIYVSPFPDADSARQQISTNGGTSPLWSREGSELFYVNDGRLYAVPVQTAPTFSRGTPTPIIEGDYRLDAAGDSRGRTYDVDASGQRFVLLKNAAGSDDSTVPSLVVVLDWFEELTRLVPTN